MKIGFCCKLVVPHQSKVFESVESANTKTTTASYITRNSGSAHQKIEQIVKHNLLSIKHLIQHVSGLPDFRRMVRLSSEILPLYTHISSTGFYTERLMNLVRTELRKAGEIARANNVRLSFHPGQFCVLASDRPEVVSESIKELEYHAMLAKMMGYCQEFQDFKINIHLSGKRGVVGFMEAWEHLSADLKSCLTVENDEFQSGLDEILPLADTLPIVLDIHHHFIRTGEYISSDDSRIKTVMNSWQGKRPVIHYAQCQEEYMNQFAEKLPSLEDLLSLAPKSKLRAHSTFFTHVPTNDWARQHLQWADVQLECKAKNLAAEKLQQQWIRNN